MVVDRDVKMQMNPLHGKTDGNELNQVKHELTGLIKVFKLEMSFTIL